MEQITVFLPPDPGDSQLEPPAGQRLSHLYKPAVMEGILSAPEVPGCAGQQPASSFTSCEEATEHTVLT